MTRDILLATKGLTKAFNLGRSVLPWKASATFHAVDDVDLNIRRGHTLALVGESGSGKSTLGRLLLRLIEATSGEIRFDGENLLALSAREMRACRRRMQIVFQDPYGSLDPYIPIGRTVEEPLQIFSEGDSSTRNARVAELLRQVGLAPEDARRYPHEFSGGQRQRISIARALALKPDFIVCDEPVSALDVSVQAQIINLLLDLQQELGLTYLFISHDLGVVRHMADDVAVMYRGRIVEFGPKTEIYARPAHPYTKGLLASMPSYDFSAAPISATVRGEITLSPEKNERGCLFRARCPLATSACAETVPPLREITSGHKAACHVVSN